MTQTYDVCVEVVSQKGTCHAGHKIGDKWIVSGKTPEGICLTAFSCLYPLLSALRFGGSFLWEVDPDMISVACADADNPVVFELRRMDE